MAKQSTPPKLTPTMMGMVPYRDPGQCARAILASCPQAARLPVMTGSFRWALEGIPLLYMNKEKKCIVMMPPEEHETELVEFYERIENQDLDHFATTAETAPFYYQFLDELEKANPDPQWVGFQIPGPLVLGDSFRQEDGTACVHHETMWDILVKGIAMKTCWLEKMLRQRFPNAEIIADHPEPTLVNFTSAVGGGSRDKLVAGVSEAFQGFGGLRWVHCCANIDWTLLTDADVDVINFDAYQLADKVALSAGPLGRFLEKGGMLGWGIVPVQGDLLAKENADSLTQRLTAGLELFEQAGIPAERLQASSWILTSCETSVLKPDEADTAFALTKEVAELAQERLLG